MSKSWYYQHDDQIQGPYSIEEMKRLASEGLLQPSALLLRMGDAPDDALTAAKVLGAACFSRGAADALLSAGADSDPLLDAGPRTPTPPPKKKPAPPAPTASPTSKPAGEERRPKVVMRIKKKPKKPLVGSAPPPPIAPPVSPPVERAPAPQASDLPEAETFIDPVDFLIGDFFAPPAKAKPSPTPASKAPEKRQPPPPPGARPRPIDADPKPLPPLAMPIEAPPAPQAKKSPPLAMPVEAPPAPQPKKTPPLAMPIEAPPVPQAKKAVPIPPPMPEAETFIDPLDFLNDAILPPAPPVSPSRPTPAPPPRIDKPRQPAPVSQTPSVPFNEAFRKARVAVDVWLDEDDNRDLVRTNDIELIRGQPEIDAIFARNEDYGPEMSDRLLQHLRFMTENRARYYNARPND